MWDLHATQCLALYTNWSGSTLLDNISDSWSPIALSMQLQNTEVRSTSLESHMSFTCMKSCDVKSKYYSGYSKMTTEEEDGRSCVSAQKVFLKSSKGLGYDHQIVSVLVFCHFIFSWAWHVQGKEMMPSTCQPGFIKQLKVACDLKFGQISLSIDSVVSQNYSRKKGIVQILKVPLIFLFLQLYISITKINQNFFVKECLQKL